MNYKAHSVRGNLRMGDHNGRSYVALRAAQGGGPGLGKVAEDGFAGCGDA